MGLGLGYWVRVRIRVSGHLAHPERDGLGLEATVGEGHGHDAARPEHVVDLVGVQVRVRVQVQVWV